MKRFFATVVFCAALLTVLSYLLFPVTKAAENPLAALLNLPAPPPPNPEVTLPPIDFDEDFFNRNKPPADDTSIEYLMAYWKQQAQDFNEIRYKVYPSDKVLERLFTEFAKDPDKLTDYLSILPPERRSADFVKEIYNRFSSGDESQRQKRSQLRRWLKYNTDQFSNELAREADRVTDTEGYVTHHRELVALARVDWDKAGPIANRLYNNPSKRASRTAALWALYAHAIETSPGDADRYRDELKATVEDKSLPDGIRDLALDALSLEKEWSGRDDWYMKLMEDDTMLDLGSYTGLTTLISASPDEKYIDRMIALLDSENISVRSAAARNLVMKLDMNRTDVLKALLPWIVDRKWLLPTINGRESVLQALGRTKMPEAVPLLINALDEKVPRYTSSYANAANAAANAAQAAANAAATAANFKGSITDTYELRTETFSVSNSNSALVYSGDSYPLRYWAISALSFQEDSRAVPALKRLLGDITATYEGSSLVTAIYNCGGFSLGEQVDAIEDVAKNAGEMSGMSNAVVAANTAYSGIPRYSTAGVAPSDIRRLLGIYLAQQYNVRDDTARAVVDRITSLDRTDPKTSAAMRKIVMRWYAPAVYMLLLRDLKHDRASSEAIVRLLSVRKELREKQQADVSDVRTGSPTAIGISACLLEDVGDYEGILDGPSDEAKTALLACGRLIRAPLSVEKVAQNLRSKDALLALAAERFLESEDSPRARQIVLSLHPNEAKILGATTAFYPDPAFDRSTAASDPFGLSMLFASVVGHGSFSTAQGYVESDLDIGNDTDEIEKRLQEEVKKDDNLLGVYNWEKNYVHIYKDRAVVSWEDDPARYRERTLTKDEFENIKGLIAHFRADELPPFLACTSCPSRQLLMLGRNGGRRVFVRVNSLPQFFAELDQTFADLRRPPSTIKYWASKTVPGLEVLYADERLDAMSVWKSGADFRLLVADKIQRQEIDNQLDEFAESNTEDYDVVIRSDDEDDDGEQPRASKVEAERTRREYENYAWSVFAAGSLTGPATQPVDAPYIPLKDNFRIAATDGQWKARSGTIEVRASSEGLFKIVAGQLTELKKGDFRDPVITPNGRWVVVTKYDDEGGPKLVRVNLATNKEIAVVSEERAAYRAVAYVASVNRVLVGPFNDEYYDYYQTDEGGSGEDAAEFSWLDPETGVVVPTRGEVRPLAQQTWRPLQPGPGAFEFWAALPKSDDTAVGLYNTRTFSFKTLVTLPKITFDSEDIWVDASEGRAYFVYEGHLLGMPLKAGR